MESFDNPGRLCAVGVVSDNDGIFQSPVVVDGSVVLSYRARFMECYCEVCCYLL